MNTDVLLRSPHSQEDYSAYYSLRWELLRQPLSLPRGSEQDQYEQQAIHCMAILNDSLVGVGRVHIDARQYAQIRYMAVRPLQQNSGIGRSIVDYLITQAQQAGALHIWCNARESAKDFYHHCGFRVVAQAHTDIAIPHLRMQYNFDSHCWA